MVHWIVWFLTACMIAMSCSAAGAQTDLTRLEGLEGNWEVHWEGVDADRLSRARLSIHRSRRAQCLQDARANCAYRLFLVKPTVWNLDGDFTQGYGEHRGIAVDPNGGTIQIMHPYYIFGHWGGEETVRRTGPDRLVGQWTYRELSGPSTWTRVVPKITSVNATGKFVKGVKKIGPRHIVVDLEWTKHHWPRSVNAGGNRPTFDVEILGNDFWGFHPVIFPVSTGIEASFGFPLTAKAAAVVTGATVSVTLWPGVRPGLHVMNIGGREVFLDLAIKNFPGDGCKSLETLIAELKQVQQDIKTNKIDGDLARKLGKFATEFYREVKSQEQATAEFVVGEVSGSIISVLQSYVTTGTSGISSMGPGLYFGFWIGRMKDAIDRTASWADADRNGAFYQYLLDAAEYPSRRRMTADTIGFLHIHRKRIAALTGQKLPPTGSGSSVQDLRAYMDTHALRLLYYFGLFEEVNGPERFPRVKLNVQGRYGANSRYAVGYWRRIMAAELKPRLAKLHFELMAARRAHCGG